MTWFYVVMGVGFTLQSVLMGAYFYESARTLHLVAAVLSAGLAVGWAVPALRAFRGRKDRVSGDT